VWGVSKVWFFLDRSYLSWVVWDSQVVVHHSSWWIPHPKWREPFSQSLHKLLFFHSFQFISISAFHTCLCLEFLLLVFLLLYAYGSSFGSTMTTINVYLISISIPHCILSITYIDFSSLPLWSEPSHLLNRLVKFVSSGNLP